MGNVEYRVEYEVPEIAEAGAFRADTGFRTCQAMESSGQLPEVPSGR